MRRMNKMGGLTRRRLLVSAGAVFAEKGYRNATVGEICERAGTNIAAVNYHFGSKEVLYRESWLHAFHASNSAHPLDGCVPANAPAHERLRGYIEAMLQRALAEDNVEFCIIDKEMAQPTGLLAIVVHEAIMPFVQMIEGAIRELIGSDADELQVRFCSMSIHSQCMHPSIISLWKHNAEKAHAGPLSNSNVKMFAEHVFRFSLQGIYAYLRR